MRILIGLLLMGIVCAKQERCAKNARYNKCGTACPLTCDNIDNPPDVCGVICIQGCQCNEGFVHLRGFGCVKPEDCPKPSSHVRRICLDQPDSGFCGGRRKMWNFNQKTGTCHQFRFEGCGGNGNRYKTEEECLAKCKGDVCGENERYNECGTYCPLTCENFNQTRSLCQQLCKQGCECESGFMRRADGRCVWPDMCQNTQRLSVVIKDDQGRRLNGLVGPYDEGSFLSLVCEAEGGNPTPIVTWWMNGQLIDVGFSVTSEGLTTNEMGIVLQRSDFLKELTCQATNTNLTQVNMASVKIVLNMKPLYVRITTPQKPVNLGEDLTLDCETSGSRPEAKIVWLIDNELIENHEQSSISRSDGSEGNVTFSSIHLKPGITDSGKVVICKAENPAMPHVDTQDTWILNVHYNICRENEHYNSCGTPCPLTCKNYGIPDRMCPDVCDEGCECNTGFVRREDGKCIRPEDCSKEKDKITEINCTDSPDPGDCEAFMMRFYYDPKEKQCKEFIYRGCGGNANNFETEENCNATCWQ